MGKSNIVKNDTLINHLSSNAFKTQLELYLKLNLVQITYT